MLNSLTCNVESMPFNITFTFCWTAKGNIERFIKAPISLEITQHFDVAQQMLNIAELCITWHQLSCSNFSAVGNYERNN